MEEERDEIASVNSPVSCVRKADAIPKEVGQGLVQPGKCCYHHTGEISLEKPSGGLVSYI